MAGKADSLKTIFFALGANFAIFVSKLAAALLTGSGSMFAEAIHSLADCGNQGLLLWGLKRTQRAPSPDFPLGFGKAIYFWSFLVALLLFSVGGMFSIYEGVHKLGHPEPLRWPWLAVGVLGFGLAAEGFSMWGCLREVNKARGDQGLWQWFRESRQSELIVVFGEDLAALLGLGFALGAVLLTMFTGDPAYDAIGGIVIGTLLVIVALFVAKEIADLLVGQSADPQLRAQLLDFLTRQPEVRRVFSLITLQLGPDVMVAVKAEMQDAPHATALVEAINRVEAALRAQFPEVRWSFFEPDVED